MSDAIEIFENMDGAELVQDTFLFRTLSFDESASLTAEFEPCSFKDGETVIEENAIGSALYVIKSGTAEVRKGGHVVARLSEGEIFGEMSLIENALTSAAVVATSALSCLRLPRTAMDGLMAGNDTFARKVYEAFCHTLSDRLRQTTEELADLREETLS